MRIEHLKIIKEDRLIGIEISLGDGMRYRVTEETYADGPSTTVLLALCEMLRMKGYV